MARDLLWVCDELYRLHKDLEEIRRRQTAGQVTPKQAAAQSLMVPEVGALPELAQEGQV
jgi:hypothetical protein